MQELTAVYARVSSDGQSVSMQLSNVSNFIQGIPASEVIFLIDDGVSATKVKMKNRPKLMELLKLITAGRVATLIVYDRDRLARNFYEYMSIAQLFIEMNVDVIFTGSNVRPFDTSLIMEAVGAMFAQFEAEAIRRRRADALKQFPVNLLGYARHKYLDGTVTYTLNEEIAGDISDFFEEIAQAADPESFVSILEAYHRKLRRDVVRLLTILTTPFYAGHWERHGKLHPLVGVPAVVSLETYKAVQEKLDSFRELVGKISAPIEETMNPSPRCGLCGGPMKFRYSKLHQTKSYQCPKHRHNSIDADKLQSELEALMLQIVQNLDYDSFRSECSAFLESELRKTKIELKGLDDQITRVAIQITRKYATRCDNQELKPLIENQYQLHQLREASATRMQSIQVLQSQLHELTDLVMTVFNNHMRSKPEQLTQIFRFMFKGITVFPGKAQVEVNFGKYFKASGGKSHVS